MGFFNANEADNYGSGNSFDFFFLKNDKDVETVRFMYENIEDVQGLAVHQVEVGGKKRYVSCIRNYNDPVSACPLCEANYAQKARVFIPLYIEAEEKVRIWERGKEWIAKLSSLMARYTPLVCTPFEIERNGKPRANDTKYETFALEADDTKLADLPEIPDILGNFVLDKTYDEIQEYLETGNFPQTAEETAQVPARDPQRDAKRSQRPQAAAPVVSRRRPAVGNTPPTRNSGREGKF